MASFKDISGSFSKDQVQQTLNSSRMKATLLADKTSRMFLSVLSTILTVVLVLAVSVFLYGTFYYAYMPVEMHNLPVHLQFQPCQDSTTRCSNPTAKIALKRNQKLLQGQPFSISLTLQIPDSPVNEDLGMFMSCLTISSTKGEQIGESCKSSISEYRSPLLRTLETFSFSPALLTGWSAQKQEVHINYFSNFQTDPHTPAEVVTVEIHSKHLQIAEASLQIHAELNGLRHLMYRHPWFSSFLGISSNIIILSSIILMSWASFLQPEETEDRTARDTSDDNMSHDEIQAEPVAREPSDVKHRKVEDETKVPKELLTSSEDSNTSVKATLGNRLKLILLKLVLKLTWQSVKLFFCAALVLVSYEAMIQGVDKPEVVVKAAKEDLVYLAIYVGEKTAVLVDIIKDKYYM